jgi:hypothetical protein
MGCRAVRNGWGGFTSHEAAPILEFAAGPLRRRLSRAGGAVDLLPAPLPNSMGQLNTIPPPVTLRRDLDDMIDVIMAWWNLPMAVSFVMALQMRSSGIGARQAKWLFEDAEQRRQ